MAAIVKCVLTMALIGGIVGLLGTGRPVQAEALTIAASHSLKPAFQEIVPMFEKEYGVTVQALYGPSHTLRHQIEQGAPIDVFLPESVEDIEKLEGKGLTIYGKPRIYAASSLVLVMSAASLATPISFHEALPNRGTRIALVDPKTSAVGAMTARVLHKINPTFKAGSNFVFGEHTEDVVDFVDLGKADAGIVHRVDAIGNGRLRIIDEAPFGKQTSVQFGAAIVSTCREASREAAQEFVDFMMSPRIQMLLLKYGFDTTSGDRRS
jgi:molybdate transport system substrate-binding protein